MVVDAEVESSTRMFPSVRGLSIPLSTLMLLASVTPLELTTSIPESTES